MQQAYFSNEDLHWMTAERIFQKPRTELASSDRKASKTISFAIPYGAGPQGLREQLLEIGLDGDYFTEEKCQELIDSFLREAYPKVGEMMDLFHSRLTELGYVWDMWGRVRHCPGIYSVHEEIRAAAKREAGNSPIQSGAQGLPKTAMNVLLEVFHEYDRISYCKPLLQIHDELLIEVAEEIAHDVAFVAQYIMEDCVKLDIPVEAEASLGYQWGTGMKEVVH